MIKIDVTILCKDLYNRLSLNFKQKTDNLKQKIKTLYRVLISI